ncbi:MAG: hypothetical protein FJW96_13135 [Actinobacteria bacterium]|nr:hypothetical protein [Actinomycetota bacterium]
MTPAEVTPYRESVTGVRALFAFGLTQDFFREERARIAPIMEALKAGFTDLEARFGVRVLGTLDDDESMVGARETWPWTCYILAEVPDHAAVARVCNLLREIEIGDARLWRYLRVEARVGRPLFFAEPPA